MTCTPPDDFVLLCIGYVEPAAVEYDDLAAHDLIVRHLVGAGRLVPVPLRACSGDHLARALADFPLLHASAIRVHDVHGIAVRR